MKTVPVITIDGPSASGKGTVAARVAARLHFQFLDSGALYRLVALAARRLEEPGEGELVELAAHLPARFEGDRVFLEGQDVSDVLRSESVGEAASRVAALGGVRDALLARQRAYCQGPGLVADGRDMGTVVFPVARTKVFLSASPEARAERRYKQLMEKGLSANLAALVNEMRARDERDMHRPVAPLRPAPGALLLDTTSLTIDEAVDAVLEHYRNTWQ